MKDNIQTVARLYEDGSLIVVPIRAKRNNSEVEKSALREKGKIKKYYALDSGAKRKLRCMAIRMFYKRKNSIKWFTLTFPDPITQQKANECLEKFINNLKNNYNAESYIIVKENHKSGNPHFHCLFDIPFVSFIRLNRIWCNTFGGFMRFSNNALTSGKKKIIYDLKGVSKYIAKYITKAHLKKWNPITKKFEIVEDAIENKHETKIFFHSNNILPKPKILNYNEYIYFTTSFKLKEFKATFFNPDGSAYTQFTTILIEDYYTVMYLQDFAYLPELFDIPIPAKKQKIPKKPPVIDAIQPNFAF